MFTAWIQLLFLLFHFYLFLYLPPFHRPLVTYLQGPPCCRVGHSCFDWLPVDRSCRATEQCCSNLRQLYSQQPGCLCLLLNQTGISTLPINTTLALQLPLLCSMYVDSDTCSVSEGLAPRSSTPQVSFGTTSNSTVAASTMVTVPPKTSSILGFGINNSSAVNFNAKESLMIITVITSWGALFWL